MLELKFNKSKINQQQLLEIEEVCSCLKIV